MWCVIGFDTCVETGNHDALRATALGVVAEAGSGSYDKVNDTDVEKLMYVCSGLKIDVH